MMRTSTWTLSFVLFSLAACGGGTAAEPAAETAPASEPAPEATASPLEAAINGAHRSEESRARDAHRHPRETLEFFGIRPDMTVIELSPGGGWYTDILAPFLREEGRLIAAVPPPSSRYAQAFTDRVAEAPEIFDRVETVIWQPPEEATLGPAGSAQMVVTFRSAHGWINRDQATSVFAAIYEVLAPGGVLGLVQHRADDGDDVSETSPRGYVPEAEIIRLATEAGLVLEERSDINRNPADTRDHPDGVWNLPPTLRTDDEEARARYEAIGESDRMTLRFVKPASAGGEG